MGKILKKVYSMFSTWLPKEDEKKIALDARKYWSESKMSERKQDLSHWRGKGRWNNDEWLKVGEHHFTLFKRLCAAYNISIESISTMLEWGPGGGSNAVKFSQIMSEIYGVDISRSNLDECSSQLEKAKFKRFYPILIRPEDPNSCITQIEKKVDFFLSTAVFQHFPSKAYGLRVLEIAYELLKPGAIAIVQIRYDNSKHLYRPKRRDYKYNAITFTSYKLDEFWETCIQVKLVPIFIHLEPEINYGYYYLRKME